MTYHRIYVNIVDTLPVRGFHRQRIQLWGDKPWRKKRASRCRNLHHHFWCHSVAALLTVFIPLGKYDTKEITYMQNGVEKTRTVLDPESFQYILGENGNKVTKAAPLLEPRTLAVREF